MLEMIERHIESMNLRARALGDKIASLSIERSTIAQESGKLETLRDAYKAQQETSE